jgi:type VI secretion system secreted protein VgrG
MKLYAWASGALGNGDEVACAGFRGRERLSEPYVFDLILVRPKPLSRAQIDEMLTAPCALAMGSRRGDVVSGMLASIEELDAASGERARYVATMVPTLSLLRHTRRSRLFCDMTTLQIVPEILMEYGLSWGRHFEIGEWRDDAGRWANPRREYVLQYNESDLDFVQRWLDHEGYFYWFEHDGERGEKLVIAHRNDECPRIEGGGPGGSISYRDRNNLAAYLGSRRTDADGSHDVSQPLATVWGWNTRTERVPRGVALVDYNYRLAAGRLVAKAHVPKGGFGHIVEYGDHFKDEREGGLLARVRAEEIGSRRFRVMGETDCPAFRVGHVFHLRDHPEANGDYLITAVEHAAGYAPALLGTEELVPFETRFEAIPADVQFRPERRTPWPTIHGVLHAHIDSEGKGKYADIDDQGRYLVVLPFESFAPRYPKDEPRYLPEEVRATSAAPDARKLAPEEGRAPSGARRRIRMAQAQAGAGYGTHFPLRHGTEVLLAHIDGDPDRPIIVGSVPTPRTRSPVTASNANQCAIRTASGALIEIHDGTHAAPPRRAHGDPQPGDEAQKGALP